MEFLDASRPGISPTEFTRIVEAARDSETGPVPYRSMNPKREPIGVHEETALDRAHQELALVCGHRAVKPRHAVEANSRKCRLPSRYWRLSAPQTLANLCRLSWKPQCAVNAPKRLQKGNHGGNPVITCRYRQRAAIKTHILQDAHLLHGLTTEPFEI